MMSTKGTRKCKRKRGIGECVRERERGKEREREREGKRGKEREREGKRGKDREGE
jgi:hypothetical protein